MRKARKNRRQAMLDKMSYVSAETHEAMLEKQLVPRYPEQRDEFTILIFSAQAWEMDLYALQDIFHEVLEAQLPKADYGYGLLTESQHVFIIFKMRWADFHATVCADDRDTNIAGVHVPMGSDAFTNSDSAFHLYHETVHADNGVHPVHGHVLFWSLSTLAKSHPMRECITQREWTDKLTPLADIMQAVLTVHHRLVMEREDKSMFRMLIASNQPALAADMTLMYQDIAGG